MIPKNIHQIWLGDQELPLKFMSSWVTYCKNYNWTYHLWREPEIDAFNLVNRYNYDLETSYQGKADIARYEIVNRYGGFYIDADMVFIATQPLDSVINLNQATFVGVNEPYSDVFIGYYTFIANGFFGAEPNCTILTNIVREIPNNTKNNNLLGPAFKTGPYLLNDHTVLTQPIVLLPTHWIFPKQFKQLTGETDTSPTDLHTLYPGALMFTYNTAEYPGAKPNKIIHRLRLDSPFTVLVLTSVILIVLSVLLYLYWFKTT